MNPFDPRLPLVAAQAKVKPCHVFHYWHAKREMGKQFHIEAFASFAGLEVRHVERIIAALEANEVSPPSRATVSQRASRLALDWQIPQEWIDWAVDEKRWSPEEVKLEADRFAAHWQSKAGKDATKTCWKRTWQNWCRQPWKVNGTYNPHVKTSDRRSLLERQLRTEEMLGRDYEAGQIRKQIAALDNMIIFELKPTD